MDASTLLDRYLPARLRAQIEGIYLAPINAQARLEQALHDPEFYQDPENYPPFYADHGLVHHRDVARQILRVLDTAHGVLIPPREEYRLESMKGYGVILAFLHDIGMVDFSGFGRAMHPEFAAHAAFDPGFDDTLQTIWDENCSNLAWRLSRLADQGALEQPPRLVLREMLAMANCHSKSRVPIETLIDLERLRRTMQERIGADLGYLYHSQRVAKIRRALLAAQQEQDQAQSERLGSALREAEANLETVTDGQSVEQASAKRLGRHYDDFGRDSYRWLITTQPEVQALVEDVVDTLRALRCADALRQRGTVLKTSGGYEVFVDRKTANAVYALRLGEDELFVLELANPLAAGEANIASSQLDPAGNLRVTFHRGEFPDHETTKRAASNAALVVNDIQGDVIRSFYRSTDPGDSANRYLKTAEDMEILLEGVDDNMAFADLVRAQLELINAQAAARTRSVPSMRHASAPELERYLQAEAPDWDLTTRQQALERIARTGQKSDEIDPVDGFRDVKLIQLNRGEVLIEAGAPSGFVYIPLGQGLRIRPLGGYASFLVQPWMPLGITGVIRGAMRNATVIAERGVPLLMIPKEAYLGEWHRPYGIDEFAQLLAQRRNALEEEEETTLTGLEKLLILQAVPLFAEIPSDDLTKLAAIVKEVRKAAGSTVFEEGERGDSMYVVVEGHVRVHAGGQVLNTLGPGDVFGEMALLDPEPRMASVTAIEDTRLLRLDGEPFHQLLAERPQVAQGIMRILSRHLRDRVADLNELRARLDTPELGA